MQQLKSYLSDAADLKPAGEKRRENAMNINMQKKSKRKKIEQEIKDYLSLKYRIEMIPDKEEGGFVAIIPDLPGCISQGETESEALKMIEEAKVAWIKATLESGKEVPTPREAYSGKLNIRIPKTLHRRLTLESEREGVSLNQEIIVSLERGLVKI